ncbi:MAG: NTP transferase domain-containing protein [Anaerolineae bacterium]|nr:NDP-sugar synthase [Anaerolineae bacterium]MDW8100174.1 NTP transferase domain-containing protein [Anaerolineae bacterium]
MAIRAAVVLAAGEGSRFWPYNVVRQKAAFPIVNVPAVRRLVNDLICLGVTRVAVVVGVGEASVRAALRGAAGEIIFVRQPNPEGTALAALAGAEGLDDDFLVIAGDVVTAKENLRELIERFERERPLAAALIQPLGGERPLDWLIAFPEDGRLRGIEGHAREGHYRLCGVYAFQPDALTYLRDNPGLVTKVPVGGMPPMEAEIAQSLQVMVDEGQIVLAVETSGYHVDLDKPWHILEANHHVINDMTARLQGNVIPPSARVHDGAEIHGRLVLGENAVIGSRVVVGGDLWLGDGASVTNGAIIQGPAVIGRGTKVRDYCQIGEYSSLGAHGVYGHGAEFSGVALDTVYCYHYCEIWGVAGQAVDFGAATVCGNLRFDDGETVWRIKGRPEVPAHASNAAYFGDFCRTGVNAIIMPGRRIGVYSIVGPGVVLYEDLPDRTMVTVKQELITRPWGPERYGW